MARKQFNEDEVLRTLHKKNDLRIDNNMKVIQVLRDNVTCGNGTLGKIDFLVNHNGWKSMLVNEFDKKDDRQRLQKTKSRNK